MREVLPGQRPRPGAGRVAGQLGQVGGQGALGGREQRRRRAGDQARRAQHERTDADRGRGDRYEHEAERLRDEQRGQGSPRREQRPQASAPPAGGEQGQARATTDQPGGPGVTGLVERDQRQRDGRDALAGPGDEGRPGQRDEVGGQAGEGHAAMVRRRAGRR
ncbi:hypothetical protein GCM10010102_28880 [Promicromonospora citrea]|uniref:Uncharacterized protein n=1 Tax=Promicromonospora citrea TaxID=43677 RepID=A0A8H9L493_9MICO|nr:hypothetical protein GCM10010102_28880 [Promicromonospora citrea]